MFCRAQNISGKCKINRKRVDGVVSDWEKAFIENEIELIDFAAKTILVKAAHGGKKPSIPVCRKFANLLFIREHLNWTNAQHNCEILGGQLFFKLDGSIQQLDDFSDKMVSGHYWIGIRREDPMLVCLSVKLMRLLEFCTCCRPACMATFKKPRENVKHQKKSYRVT